MRSVYHLLCHLKKGGEMAKKWQTSNKKCQHADILTFFKRMRSIFYCAGASAGASCCSVGASSSVLNLLVELKLALSIQSTNKPIAKYQVAFSKKSAVC